MGNENLQIVKVALTVVTPRTGEDVLNVGVASLFLSHFDVVLEPWLVFVSAY